MSGRPRARNWFKSSLSKASETCVEVCFDGGRVGVRDSKCPGGPELFFEGSQWDTFLRSRVWQR
ncbi:DUF397 domain-containing protein [Nocardia sp. CDC160]|uniref:DUF397 domain-containing protein n=1 Tax=Nocardia sp. CDC160 TaxID=3112166 RepID=UPI002DBAFDF7|nr:DUF397 domain-containing protein [Nocardia sp. CDC160]MEC3913279.1 DUF397 domain-containing protein [Nocardia sp. CDC160]